LCFRFRFQLSGPHADELFGSSSQVLFGFVFKVYQYLYWRSPVAFRFIFLFLVVLVLTQVARFRSSAVILEESSYMIRY